MGGIRCMAFIMDGNRRWAKDNKLKTIEGHKAGFRKFKEVLEWAKDTNIEHLVFYAFSSENWKRKKTEVSDLLELFVVAASEMDVAHKHKIRVRIIGDRHQFSKKLQELINRIEEETANYKGKTVSVALSYGGRAEIVSAVNELLESGRSTKINEEEFSNHLWTKGIPDPDIVVRTGDSMRLSNFLPWQSVYSELYFTNTYWPDFDREEFEYILDEYNERERRHGA